MLDVAEFVEAFWQAPHQAPDAERAILLERLLLGFQLGLWELALAADGGVWVEQLDPFAGLYVVEDAR